MMWAISMTNTHIHAQQYQDAELADMNDTLFCGGSGKRPVVWLRKAFHIPWRRTQTAKRYTQAWKRHGEVKLGMRTSTVY